MKNGKLVEVIVKDYSQNDFRTFTYYLKGQSNCKVGSMVLVPFGKKTSLGIISKIYYKTDKKFNFKLKDVEQVLDFLPLPNHIIDITKWLCEYYVASSKSVLQTILPSGLTVRNIRQTKNEKPDKFTLPEKIKLNAQQKEAIKIIKDSTNKNYLLHGVTGSGKTEVYIDLIKDQFKKNKSTILLIPEISLTPQTVERFYSHFPNQILVTHSKLTSAKRRNIWLEALNSDSPKLIIGPRSALFAPLKKLGLIIIDEEHETSYKQESPPKYHAVSTAAKIVHLTKAKLVLGSATPSVNTYFFALAKKIRLVTLDKRARGQDLPNVQITDLKKQKTLISDQLLSAIKQTLRANRQVILFLNRRGSANAMICTSCAQTVKCPNCDTSLTYHADKNKLICHYCAFVRSPEVVCEKCHNYEMVFVGSGTKKVEQIIQDSFKKAKIARIDKDNSDFVYLKKIYEKLKKKQIDILIGTQMITRGLDIEGVDLVGVILAENMLAIPDFASSERTFNLLTQVAGRAGRGLNKAQAIIQTYSPHHFVINSAKKHDYLDFFEQEIKKRKKYLYPPYSYLLKLVYAHKDEAVAKQKATLMSQQLEKDNKKILILGPASCFLKKRANKYRYQIIIKAFDRQKLTNIALSLPNGWSFDLDPINLI